MKISFNIDLPDSLNRWHNKCWQAKMREKDKFCSDIDILILEQTGCPMPRYEKAKIKYTIHSSRLWDADGRVTICKIVNDAIVRAGLLKDDSPKHLEYNLPEFKVDKTKRMVEVEIEVNE